MRTVWGVIALVFLGVALMSQSAPAAPPEQDGLIILCYHDVPREVTDDDYGVDQATFINTIEFFRAHGYTFVGVDDVLAAEAGEKPLPEKSVMLTFDDAYVSFYDFVFPILKEYGIPSVLAVVTGWVEHKPDNVLHEVMSWSQLKEIARSGLVEIATHSHNMHRGVIYNPQGNEAAAAANRRYLDETGGYEPEKDYRRRIRQDLANSIRLLESKLGVNVRVIAWPYGKYNAVTVEEAGRLGLKVNLALNDKRADPKQLGELNRYLIHKNPPLKQLRRELGLLPVSPDQGRIVQVDLDLIFDEDSQQTEENLGEFLERIKTLKPSTVYLQAFADPVGTGNIKEVYFPNRVLPVRADLFNRVVHQLKTRAEVEVYAWMPMLSFVLPDQAQNESLRVRSYQGGAIGLSDSWYERWSPFSEQAREKIAMIYDDLSSNAWIDGVVFQDDGYLNDHEDYHPQALDQLKAITGGEVKGPEAMTEEELERWTNAKTAQLNDLSRELMAIVKRNRPETRFARIVYAPILTEPYSEEWFAQNYADSLTLYDYTVIMAYPMMEEAEQPDRWLSEVVRAARAYPRAMEKTVFKIQSFDWENNAWIDSLTLNRWLKTLVAAGARFIGYYPDDYTVDRPQADIIRMMMSTEDFPFYRDKKRGRGMYD